MIFDTSDPAWWQVIITAISVPLSFLGIGLAAYALLQTNKSLKLAEAGQRPWLAIVDTQFRISAMSLPEHLLIVISADLKVKNCGHNPALNLMVYADAPESNGRKMSDSLVDCFARYRARRPGDHGGQNVAPNEAVHLVRKVWIKLPYPEADVPHLPTITVAFSLIYNLPYRDPPYETSQAYRLGKFAEGQVSMGFTIQEILEAPMGEGPWWGGLECEAVLLGYGAMV